MDLDEIGLRCGTDKASSHHDYLRTYERVLAPYRGRAFVLMEFGVDTGASLLMWAQYFAEALVVGVDVKLPTLGKRLPLNAMLVEADCTLPLDEPVRVVAPWGGRRKARVPAEVDVIIDDASHEFGAIHDALAAQWPRLAPGGLYIVEDACCLFWGNSNGGRGPAQTFGGRLLTLVNHGGLRARGSLDIRRRDELPEFVDEALGLRASDVASVHFYNSLVVIEKARR